MGDFFHDFLEGMALTPSSRAPALATGRHMTLGPESIQPGDSYLATLLRALEAVGQ